jgi:hypothetical protein
MHFRKNKLSETLDHSLNFNSKKVERKKSKSTCSRIRNILETLKNEKLVHFGIVFL